MPLLVTCFEPFDGRASNTSMRLMSRMLQAPPDGVEARVLPVDFQALKRTVPRLLGSVRPKRWLLIGEYGGGDLLRCERIATNLLDGDRPDNQGQWPRGTRAVRGGPDAYFTTLDPARLRDHFLGRGIPAAMSDSAGTYACNLALYLALHHVRRGGQPTRVGFLHVPRHYRRTGHTLRDLRVALHELAVDLSGARA